MMHLPINCSDCCKLEQGEHYVVVSLVLGKHSYIYDRL